MLCNGRPISRDLVCNSSKWTWHIYRVLSADKFKFLFLTHSRAKKRLILTKPINLYKILYYTDYCLFLCRWTCNCCWQFMILIYLINFPKSKWAQFLFLLWTVRCVSISKVTFYIQTVIILTGTELIFYVVLTVLRHVVVGFWTDQKHVIYVPFALSVLLVQNMYRS